MNGQVSIFIKTCPYFVLLPNENEIKVISKLYKSDDGIAKLNADDVDIINRLLNKF